MLWLSKKRILNLKLASASSRMRKKRNAINIYGYSIGIRTGSLHMKCVTKMDSTSLESAEDLTWNDSNEFHQIESIYRKKSI